MYLLLDSSHDGHGFSSCLFECEMSDKPLYSEQLPQGPKRIRKRRRRTWLRHKIVAGGADLPGLHVTFYFAEPGDVRRHRAARVKSRRYIADVTRYVTNGLGVFG